MHSKMMNRSLVVLSLALALISACDGADDAQDASVRDADAPPVDDAAIAGDAGHADAGSVDAGSVDAGPGTPSDVIRGRFESTAAVRECGGLARWESPDGPLLKFTMNVCGDDMSALADTLVANLDAVADRGQRALIVLNQGPNLPDAWLARCETYSLVTGRFSGDLCLPWDASYLDDLRSALVDVIGPRVRGHAALEAVYFTTTTMTNGAEMHFRVDRSEFPYPGDAVFQGAYRQVMDIHQQAFDVPIVFEAGHCIWSGSSPDCATPLDLYRYTRDTYGLRQTGVAIWNCAERFWAGTGTGAETFGALALLEEATADGASIGCQTVGNFTQQACRFSDADVGDYGTATPGMSTMGPPPCVEDGTLDPEGACVDTMRWFAGVEARAEPTLRIRGTWGENWSTEFSPSGVYETSAACRAAIDLLAPE